MTRRASWASDYPTTVAETVQSDSRDLNADTQNQDIDFLTTGIENVFESDTSWVQVVHSEVTRTDVEVHEFQSA